MPDTSKLQTSRGEGRQRYQVVTGRINGTPVRVLKNKMTREYVQQEREGASKEELEVYTLGALRRAVFDGDDQNGSLMAGQVAGSHERRPVAVILEELYTVLSVSPCRGSD